MSRLSSRENNENVNTYLELLKIGDAHFSGKTCYIILTSLKGADSVTMIVTKNADPVTIVTN